jgi:hypothetical protein
LLIGEIDLLETEIAEKDIAPFIEVRSSCKKVIESIRECILLTGFSGSDYQFSNGISLFFPWSLTSYQSAKRDYEKLSFIKENEAGEKWNTFLKKYLNEVTLRKSKPLTPTDQDGEIVIPANPVSVVYESYANMGDSNEENTDIATTADTRQPPDGARQPPDGARQPPDGARQPPDGMRQPPDGARMFSAMNIFLSHFKVLKNFQSNWNRTGFTSTKVTFIPKPESESRRPIRTPGGKPTIEIPIARSILKRIDDVFFRLNELGKTENGNENIEEYAGLLKEIVKNADEPTTVELLEDLSRSTLFDSVGVKEENLKVDLKDAFSKSITSISDETIRGKILENLDKISAKK